MKCRASTLAWLALGLLVMCPHGLVAAPESAAAVQRTTLDRLLAAYLEGDNEIVARTFQQSKEFHTTRVAEPQRLERWLGTWQRGKVGLVLELAMAAARVAPQYTRFLLDAGRRYLVAAHAAGQLTASDERLARVWHRAALGLLQGGGNAETAEHYLEGLAKGMPATDPRLVLARAIAMEQRCWFARPILDRPDIDVETLMQAARITVRDFTNPSKSFKLNQAEAQRKCLQDAVARFKVAAGNDETRIEAQVRGGWLQFQLGNFREALEQLEMAEPNGDRDVVYWSALFRGRVLDRVGQADAAVTAYREALAIVPSAQSATIGLTLALFRADRVAEADEIARSYRASAANAVDPWWIYCTGDHRFVPRWVDEIRTLAR